MGSGRLVAAFLDLAEADVVDDQEFGPCPSLESAGIRAVGETGVEVVEEVDATRVAHADSLLAGSHGEGLEDVALACAALSGDDEIVAATDEVEAGELEDQRLVESRLEGPVESLERLALDETAVKDAGLDTFFEALGGLAREDVLEQSGRAGALTGCPRE